ncbi:MAG TPA: hypothetical protein VNF73_12860 [Candidatus Saccharimonadales bacterium]|nr:hypothetical protein [Candidatus Saccharimonadales bacterium]
MLVVIFLPAAATSLVASAVLVARLVRLGERFGLSEAILGLLAALAADAPEITSAVAAITGGRAAVGLGVTLGSNVFNLAALLGLGALVAGRIALHRRVVELEGLLALVVALACLAVVAGGLAPGLGLAISLVALVPYVVVASRTPAARARLPLGDRLRTWLSSALAEEEADLADALPADGTQHTDVAVAIAAMVIVVAASLVMEQAATTLGTQAQVPDIIIGGVVLAATTSLPNAVAAVYLAVRGRGEATLSEAFNSNAINVVVGFLVPATIAGAQVFSGGEQLVAWSYLGLTALAVVLAWRSRGLGRRSGLAIIAGYAVFAVVLATR